MPFSEVDDIANLRRHNRTFRNAYRELQKTGWYHSNQNAWNLLQTAKPGFFLVHDGPSLFGDNGDYCLFVIEESNGRNKTSTEIGIIFDVEDNTFELDETVLHRQQQNPPFKSICDLVDYHRMNGIDLDEDFAYSNWECDYEEESDVYEGMLIVSGREEGPDSDEVESMLENLVDESKDIYRSVTLYKPILEKD